MSTSALKGSRLLGVSEAARYLGVSVASIRHWSDAGDLNVFRTPGNQRRYRRTDLSSFMSSMRNGNGRRA